MFRVECTYINRDVHRVTARDRVRVRGKQGSRRGLPF